jgi:ketosteroid isomerase-like protein
MEPAMTRFTSAALALAACLFASTASAATDDAFTTLIKQRIEAFSDASSRNDQTAMNSLLDDAVLFSSGSGAVDRDDKFDKSDAVAALLKQQTQAFHDAAQRGDLAAMKRYLAADFLFVNEDGMVSSSRDFRGDALGAASKDSSFTLTDWVLHYSGDVAVSTFVGSQDLTHKFLFVEAWFQPGTDWKLISSHATPLYQDPPAATLGPAALQDYAGTYTGGPGLGIVISIDGGALAVSTNGAKAVTYDAEGGDIFFTPGLPPGTPRSRLKFHRDKNGHIAGYVSGRGLIVTKGEPAPSASSPTQTKQDPTQAPSSTVLPAADLVVQRHGDVAVSTFIHERVTQYYGQVLHTKYRSTETWIQRGAEWKMLTLQSCELTQEFPVPKS